MHLDVEESGLGKMFGNAMSGANFEISGKMFGNAMSGANFEISDKQMKAT